MNELAELIDHLPPPQFPDSVREADRQLIMLLLASAKQQVRPFTGTLEATWLLNSFLSDVWHTTNKGREELIDGQWKNTVCIDWRILLPNGCLLTDERYEKLLTVVKKICFFIRSDLICGTSTPKGWKAATNLTIGIARWVVLHENRFQPAVCGLSLIDQSALDWLFGEYAEGGMTQAMQIPQRCLAVLYRGAHGSVCPAKLLDNPHVLPSSEIKPIVRWVESQGGYAKLRNGQYSEKRILSREWLGQLISEYDGVLRSARARRFFRQFEPDFANKSLLVSASQRTEFPSQRVESMDGEGDSSAEKSIETLFTNFGSILDAHRHLPDLLPDPASLSLRRAIKLANRITRASGHTPFMPVNTGLTYLNAAMRFVHLYGETIIGLYLAVMPSYKGKAAALNTSLKRHANNWCIASGEPITKVLNITEFRRQEKQRDFSRLRSNPTLDDVLRVLIGSCIVCMAILKPSREEELTHLNRHCLRHDNNGYWLNFNLGKSNVKGVEAWQEADRPIPVITAKAIQLLQRLGDGLSQILGEDRKAADNLFYLPRFTGLGALSASNVLLNEHLDLFCDFVGLPPDSEGRRWYVRIHEMRKWFLLLLFWSGRFDVLDAARWIAGHTDAAHIYAYIEKEFPGEELPQIEAQYSEERLRQLKQGDSGNEDGANALYEAVLRHFKVESLNMIPEAEWTGYVKSLREADRFHLEPHSIKEEDGSVVGINVSFVMRELP